MPVLKGTFRATANEMGIGNCGALIVEANLLLFQAMRLSAALTRLFGVSGPMPATALLSSPTFAALSCRSCASRAAGAGATGWSGRDHRRRCVTV